MAERGDDANTEVSPTDQARLTLSGAALVANWRMLAGLSGSAQTGAAVKADGYGLGAREVVQRLYDAGCRDFFVAQPAEALAIADLVPPNSIAVLNGLVAADVPDLRAAGARPVINSITQAQIWHAAGGGLCDLMIDTGMARLGIAPEEVAAPEVAALDIDIVMSHLASADEDSAQNACQLMAFREATAAVKARRRSLANSAGITLGKDYHFDLTRPGLSLYGGVPVAALADVIQPVAALSARVAQVRDIASGTAVGYGATFVAPQAMRTATLTLGYADGYRRAFAGTGVARWRGGAMPVLGRVSMDLIIVDASAADGIAEGDYADIDYDLAETERISGISQYELLTGLGHRLSRRWVG